ncbi:zinc-ribbon domain-containing protein [Halobacterium hubeiense]|uniref:zinc-ribbon domain-containing protein n=1 Tax=Halobacterium hubeiense TaxID=1407499 RepID=UPI00211B5400|nr:zinc-ribbon domain-containing protein [Halobacterium hubeiense]
MASASTSRFDRSVSSSTSKWSRACAYSWECRNCGEALSEDAEECPRCGAENIARYEL